MDCPASEQARVLQQRKDFMGYTPNFVTTEEADQELDEYRARFLESVARTYIH